MVDGAEENGFVVLEYKYRVRKSVWCRSRDGSIQHMLFVRLWDLKRVGWVDRGWSRGRGPILTLVEVKWGNWGESSGYIPALIDIFWYVIVTLTYRCLKDCLH